MSVFQGNGNNDFTDIVSYNNIVASNAGIINNDMFDSNAGIGNGDMFTFNAGFGNSGG